MRFVAFLEAVVDFESQWVIKYLPILNLDHRWPRINPTMTLLCPLGLFMDAD
jgi:hypothetical protein